MLWKNWILCWVTAEVRFLFAAWKTIRHGDSFWWIAVSIRPNLHCIHHFSFHFKSDRQIKECKALNFLIQMSYRWLIYYSCNLSRNKRSLFGAKVGNDTANHAWTNPPAIAKQRGSPRPCSSLDVSLNWLTSARMRPNMKILNPYNKCAICLAWWSPAGARKWIPLGGIPPRNIMSSSR